MGRKTHHVQMANAKSYGGEAPEVSAFSSLYGCFWCANKSTQNGPPRQKLEETDQQMDCQKSTTAIRGLRHTEKRHGTGLGALSESVLLHFGHTRCRLPTHNSKEGEKKVPCAPRVRGESNARTWFVQESRLHRPWQWWTLISWRFHRDESAVEGTTRESGWAKPTVVEERANARLSKFIACTSSNAERSVEQEFLKLCVIVPHLLHMTRLRSFLPYGRLSGVLSCTVRVLDMWKELV